MGLPRVVFLFSWAFLRKRNSMGWRNLFLRQQIWDLQKRGKGNQVSGPLQLTLNSVDRSQSRRRDEEAFRLFKLVGLLHPSRASANLPSINRKSYPWTTRVI